jgi:uncharacterized protein YjbI with pentapeptide repeats
LRFDLAGADLRGFDLTGYNLAYVDFVGADFRDARLRNVAMNNSDLSEADLRGADLRISQISGTRFVNANLTSANLSYSHMFKTDFTNARLGLTFFGAVDLSHAIGLDSVSHDAPSIVDVLTFIYSEGNLSVPFLRGAGVPEPFILYSKSLSNQPLQFYSCFISYSTRDQDFADRLHADLQVKGVRCWLATEDLKIGDPFRQRIDESIRLHDKLLLILSEHSVQSAWVQDEVESALERERREKRLVLFPIRIDDAVMETDQAWAASIRRTRHIGDFTRWKDHDSYQTAFERLLRDLKAAPARLPTP